MKKANWISSFSTDAPGSELLVREAFLRMAKETLDGQGIETWTIDQLRGALTLLEKFNEIINE